MRRKSNDWYAAVHRLRANEDFKTFVRDLHDELIEQDAANRTALEEGLYRGQGKALYLAGLVEDIEASSEVVHKHR